MLEFDGILRETLPNFGAFKTLEVVKGSNPMLILLGGVKHDTFD